MAEAPADLTTHYKLRQLALVARELAPVEEALLDIFGVKVAHRDPGVGKFGLENIVIPFGNQFIEVVAPIEDGTTAERYLDRRGGDGGYMVILQTDNPKARDHRARELGMRKVHGIDRDAYDGLQLHPRDTGGTFLEIDWTIEWELPDGAWYPAGDGWQAAKAEGVVSGLAAAEIQSPDPLTLAERWGAILGLPVSRDSDVFDIVLDDGHIRFVADRDGRGEGLAAIDVLCDDPSHVWRTAEKRGCLEEPDQVVVGGVRFNLLSP